MNGEQAYAFALANAAKNPDGSVVEESLIEVVAHAVDFDADKERLGLARRIVSRRKRPGQTAAAGAVCFPGMEEYAYEPDRLVADDSGNVIRNRDAKPEHKQAEARRADEAAQKAHDRWELEQLESEHFTAWEKEQRAAGRDPKELTWDACVRETGLWKGLAAEDVTA